MKEKGAEGIGRSEVSSHPFSPNQQPQPSSQFSRYLRTGSFQARFICSLVLKVLQTLSCLCVSPFALLDASYMHTHTPLLENLRHTQQKPDPRITGCALNRNPGKWDTCHTLQPQAIAKAKKALARAFVKWKRNESKVCVRFSSREVPGS